MEKLAEVLGFYYGDGSTSMGVTSFRLTNAEPSVLDYCLEVLEQVGIPRERFKVQVIYSTPGEINAMITERCIKFWSQTLRIPRNNVVSVLKVHNVRETKPCGSARLCIDSAAVVELFLYVLLPTVLRRILTPVCAEDRQCLRGFMRGLLAAEGFPEFNVKGTLTKIGIAYDRFSEEPKVYKKLLSNMGVHAGRDHRNCVYVYGRENLITFAQMDGFKMHSSRKSKLLRGMQSF